MLEFKFRGKNRYVCRIGDEVIASGPAGSFPTSLVINQGYAYSGDPWHERLDHESAMV